jgi:hypothetical protein
MDELPIEPKKKQIREKMGPGMLRPRERAVIDALPKVSRIKDVPMILEKRYPDMTVDQVYGIKYRITQRALDAYSLIGIINHLRQTSPKVDKWLTPKARVDIKTKDPSRRLKEE